MEAADRRAAILRILGESRSPMSAASLAMDFSVSRQIIVGDIALLRAGGEKIIATPRGYILAREDGGFVSTVACVHNLEGMERELNIMVDNGCTVVNVIVEHPVYGQMTGELNLSSRYDVRQFMSKVRDGRAQPLSVLTDGIHLHTLSCPDEAAFQRTKDELRAEKMLFEQ